MSKQKNAQDDSPSLQQQMDELAALVEKLEDPELPLEQALSLYESGMALARSAQSALEAAEQRVRVINELGEEQALDT